MALDDRGEKRYDPACGQLAIDNNTLAMQRNVLANERTFSAWLRTGLALTVAAVALPRIIHFVRWAWALKLIGLVFIVVSMVIFIVAYWRYDAENKKLLRVGVSATPAWILMLLTAGMLIAAVISVALLFHE